VTKSTTLSTGPINGAEVITVELIQPDSMPAVVRIVWPTAPTITTPARYLEVSAQPCVCSLKPPQHSPESERAGGCDLVDAECLSRSDTGLQHRPYPFGAFPHHGGSRLQARPQRWPVGARNPRCADRNPPRFDAPDSAHYAYRRTLTCGPTGCGSASHHTVGSTVHLSGRSPRPHNPVWAAPEPAALPTPSHALTVWRALRGRRELAARLLRRLTRSADYAGRSRRYVWWSRCSPEPLPK